MLPLSAAVQMERCCPFRAIIHCPKYLEPHVREETLGLLISARSSLGPRFHLIIPGKQSPQETCTSWVVWEKNEVAAQKRRPSQRQVGPRRPSTQKHSSASQQLGTARQMKGGDQTIAADKC